ncbi:MAG: NADPH-dependent F420 reductase [Acidimicrobiales bacterium]
MEVTVVGTGFIGGILGNSLARSGHTVTFGSRKPDPDEVVAGSGATVASVPDALSRSDTVILALPGAAVAEFAAENGEAIRDKLIIDATNRMSEPVSNSRSSLPAGIRYARAFNTLGGENMADPVFEGGRADMFFSAPEGDRSTMETVIEGVGLRPVYVGEDQEDLIDSLFRLWIALAMGQGRGRRLAFKLLEG